MPDTGQPTEFMSDEDFDKIAATHINYPVNAKSVTGHDIIVHGYSTNKRKFLAELKSRSSKDWEITSFYSTGLYSRYLSASTRDLDMSSIEGLPVHPANAESKAEHANYKSKFTGHSQNNEDEYADDSDDLGDD